MDGKCLFLEPPSVFQLTDVQGTRLNSKESCRNGERRTKGEVRDENKITKDVNDLRESS